MDRVASSCQADERLRLPGEEPRRAAIRFLRAAGRSADRRERESLRRRAADLILPRERPRAAETEERINRG